MSQFHAAKHKNIRHSAASKQAGEGGGGTFASNVQLSDALSALLGRPVKIADQRPLERQGAVNSHWRLTVEPGPKTEAPVPNSFILRSRYAQALLGADAGKIPSAFPAHLLNDMARQDFWHRHAIRAGARAAKSYGWIDDARLGCCLVLEDLAAVPLNQPPRDLVPLSRLSLSDPERLRVQLRAAVLELVAFHQADTSVATPADDLNQPPVPELTGADWQPLARIISFSDGQALAKQAAGLLGQTRARKSTARHQGKALRPLHGDFRLGNLLMDRRADPAAQDQEPRSIYLLDFDFSGLGHVSEDLGWLSAPCWSSGALQDQALEASWLLDCYEALGGPPVSRAELTVARLQAQMRWLAIAMLQARRTGRSLEALYADEPRQHPRQVLLDALRLAEQV